MRRVRHDTSVVRGLMHTETYSRLLVTMWPAGESGARDVFAVVDGGAEFALDAVAVGQRG